MKTIIALAGASLLALSVPALAQNAGAPGAVGTGGSLTGSNPGTGFGSDGPLSDRINPGPGPSAAYPDSPGNGGVYEGRAGAPDYDSSGVAGPARRTYRQSGSDDNQQ